MRTVFALLAPGRLTATPAKSRMLGVYIHTYCTYVQFIFRELHICRSAACGLGKISCLVIRIENIVFGRVPPSISTAHMHQTLLLTLNPR